MIFNEDENNWYDKHIEIPNELKNSFWGLLENFFVDKVHHSIFPVEILN